MSPTAPGANEQQAWNEAHDRLVQYLSTFALGDHTCVSKLALDFISQARELHKADAASNPTHQTMTHAQKQLTEWLAANLGEKEKSSAEIMAAGYVALLLSRLYRNAPDSFLATPTPEEVRQSLRQTLIVTGPDLNISSMTPRHLDYGPMLQFARQTWHRWEPKELVIAILFWAGVYTVFYWWLSQTL